MVVVVVVTMMTVLVMAKSRRVVLVRMLMTMTTMTATTIGLVFGGSEATQTIKVPASTLLKVDDSIKKVEL